MKKKDWTGIHFLEKTLYYDGKSSIGANILWSIVSFASFIVLQMSAFSILCQCVSMYFDPLEVFCVIAAVSGIFWLIACRPWIFWSGTALFCIGMFFFWWYKSDVLYQGFLSIYERACVLVTDYMNGIIDHGASQGKLSVLVYCFIAVIFCIYGAVCYLGLKTAAPVLIPGILWILAAFFVGKVPNVFYLILFFISSGILLTGSYALLRFGKYGTLTALGRHFYIRGEKNVIKKMGLKTGIYVFVMLLICAGLSWIAGNAIGLPEKETLAVYQKQIRDWSRENLHLFEGWGESDAPPKGGISGGNLADAKDLYYYGDEQIKVTVGKRPESNLYIKGYVGDSYENNQWKSVNNEIFDIFTGSIGESGTEEIFNFSYKLLSQFGTDHMAIDKLAVFGNFEFIPYGAMVENNSQWVNDLYIQGTSGGTEFDFTPVIYPLSVDYEDLIIYSQQFLEQNEALKIIEESYRDYVYEQYMIIPASTKQMLDEFTGENVPSGLKEKVAYVRRLLADTCTYSLTPGELPDGKDFTQYFLMENRRGYCMHFATAATLLLRNMGIPARYVEGYILAPGNFKSISAGYEGIAYDHQAHAWAEIYVDGVGWLPVEMTPTYYDEQEISGDETLETETQTETQMQSHSSAESQSDMIEQTQEQQPQTLENESDPGQTEGFSENHGNSSSVWGAERTNALSVILKIVLWLLACLVCIFIIVAIVIFRALILRNKYRKCMCQNDRNRAVVCIYGELLRLFEICGYVKADQEEFREYFDRIGREYSFVNSDACEEIVSMANKAAFGKNGITSEQWIACWKIYKDIRSHMYKCQKKRKQLLMKYIHVC